MKDETVEIYNKPKIVIVVNSFVIKSGMISLLTEYFTEIALYDSLQSFENILPYIQAGNKTLVIAESKEILNFQNLLSNYNKTCIILPLYTERNYLFDPEMKYSFDIFDTKDSILETIQRATDELNNYNHINETNILSVRETDIICLVAKGFSSQMIADELFISLNTVNTHRKNIANKLGIKTVSGQTAYAIINNLIQLDEAKLV